jgi:hypothetical protein
MQASWSGTPEAVSPVAQIVKQEGEQTQVKVITVPDFSKVPLRYRMDLPAGGSPEALAVAFKHVGEPDCFAFSAENYFAEPDSEGRHWKLPRHKLEPGEFVVWATVRCGAISSTKRFLFRNFGTDLRPPGWCLEDWTPDSKRGHAEM